MDVDVWIIDDRLGNASFPHDRLDEFDLDLLGIDGTQFGNPTAHDSIKRQIERWYGGAYPNPATGNTSKDFANNELRLGFKVLVINDVVPDVLIIPNAMDAAEALTKIGNKPIRG